MMNERILPKGFFRNNPIEKISAANISYFKMTVGFEAEIEQMLSEGISKGITVERRAHIEEEKKTIAELSTAEEIVSFMRTKFDITNQNLLCKKALTMQDQVIPLMLRRYRTTLQDVFVDTAVQILAHAEKHHTETLLKMYPEIRNPYAKSMACLVLGMQRIERAAPLLLAEYERMKKEYTKESLCQGPLLGLYVLYGKA